MEYLLSDKDLGNKIHTDLKESRGFYYLYSKKGGKRRQTNRLYKIDKQGILYIGQTKNLVNRITGLKKTIDPDYKSEPHICGRRYNINSLAKKKFPYESLYVKLEPSKNHKELEKDIIRSYFMEFGEVPPFNAI